MQHCLIVDIKMVQRVQIQKGTIQIQKVQRKRSEKKRAANTEITRDTPIQATS